MKRPILIYIIAYISGIFISQCFKYSTAFLITAALLIFGFIIVKNKKILYIMLIFTILVNLGCAYTLYKSDLNRSRLAQFADQNVKLHGVFLEEVKRQEDTIVFLAYIKSVNEREIKAEKIRGTYYKKNISDISFRYGQAIVIDGVIEIPDSQRNPGGFNYKKYLLTKNIYTLLKTKRIEIDSTFEEQGNILIKLSLKIKDKMSKVILKSLPKRQSALLEGIVLSKTDNLDEMTKNNFSGAGLSHLMAVSGMNVAFIVAPLLYISRKFKINQLISASVITIILIIFTIITGSSPSVLRAVIMSLIVIYGEVMFRKSDILTSIAFSAFLLLTYNPNTLFDIGFQLSYSATLALILLCSKITDILSFMPKLLKEAVAVTLSAQIGVVPIVVYYFNKVSLISFVSNILAAPLSGITLTLGLLMSLLGQINYFLCEILAGLNYILLSVVLFIADKSVLVPYSVITVPTPSVLSIFIYYIIVLTLLFYGKQLLNKLTSKKFIMYGIIIIVSVLVLNIFSEKNLEVSFIDVGQGDSVFIRTPKNKVVLIDGGNTAGKSFDVGDRTIIPFLLDKGIRTIDLIVLTHMDDDHISGIGSIIKNMNVKTVLVSKAANNEKLKESIINEMEGKKTKLVFADSTGKIDVDKNTFFNLYLNPIQESENDKSIVLQLVYKNNKFLFTGDISQDQERNLILLNRELQCDVLKVAHHGAKTSTSDEFLDKVNVKAAVISVGEDNRFGHPSKDVIKRIKDRNSKVFRTDEDGCVSVFSDGNNLRITTMNGDNKI